MKYACAFLYILCSPHFNDVKSTWEQECATPYFGVCHGRISSASSMTRNHSLSRSLCTHRWTRACSLTPEARSFWLALQAGPALSSSMYSVQHSAQRSRKFFLLFFRADWCWQQWRTWYSAATAFIAKRPGVAYSCSRVLLTTYNHYSSSLYK